MVASRRGLIARTSAKVIRIVSVAVMAAVTVIMIVTTILAPDA